ncbi:MAG: hypothetical protein ACKV2T_33465 [Kofleriaceae bacterium]
MRRILLGIMASLAACGGLSADAPIRTKLGTPRDQALAELRAQKFCFEEDGPPQRVETYPRCERAGAEWGEGWVTATYDNGKLVELRRYERFADDARAVERWNQLVQDRKKVSPDAPDADEALRRHGPLEPGTRSVKAFQLDPTTLVAVYLLTPSPPENASILEAILAVTAVDKSGIEVITD